MNEIHEQIMQAAVEKYGKENQMRMLQEECGELIVATSHYIRKREYAEDEVVEELADVLIMCEQIKFALGITTRVAVMIDRKLGRLASKL